MASAKIIRQFKSKKGNDVVFRYPRKEDFTDVWNLACDLVAEDTFIELAGISPTEHEEHAWFDDVLEKIAKKESLHISVFVNGHFAGNGRVDKGKYRHSHVGHIGLSLALPYREEGIGTELLKTLIDGSRPLGIKLLTLSCFENNPRALHVYEKLGFMRYGVLPKAISFKGDYINEIHFYLPVT